MIPARAVWCLGLSQLVAWGTTYYLVGAFGEDIATELGWSRETVHGGFSAALLVMGLTSGTIGGLIDRFGGRWVMSAGAGVGAVVRSVGTHKPDKHGMHNPREDYLSVRPFPVIVTLVASRRNAHEVQ